MLKFASNLPYPQIESNKDIAQSKLLMPLYAGTASELTSVMTYCFQSYISSKNQDICTALKNVAKVEMKHHELLGNVIYKLGGYPIMGARTYWSGNFVDYTLNPAKFLQQNIKNEQSTILNMERTILNVENESVKSLLSRIILDEEMHIEVFKQLLDMSI